VVCYAELHCKTNFSFLEGASHPEELVEQAVRLDYQALAITDRHSLAGVVRAHAAARQTGLKLIFGAELHLPQAPPLVVWCPDRGAYGRLARLLTIGRRRAPKGECLLFLEDLERLSEGLLVGLVPRSLRHLQEAWKAQQTAPSGRSGRRPAAADSPLSPEEFPSKGLDHWAHRIREIFGDRAYLLAELHYGADDQAWLARLRRLARAAGLPLVAAGDVHYHTAARMVVQDVLTAIRLHRTVDQVEPVLLVEPVLFPNAQRHLRTLDQLRSLYADAPDIVDRTQEIVDRCRFSLETLRYEYPEELAPAGLTPLEYLRQLTWQGAHRRFPQGIPAKVRSLLEHELDLIEKLQYEAYFLTVWDLVRFARRQGILCQGRGSAANSVVCYCLEITSVDPERIDTLFERFVSQERNEAPDIDVDFEHERREEVLQYVYHKYGRERAGLAAEVITYRLRSAIRDVGKALGWSLDRVDALAKQVERVSHDEPLEVRCRQVGVNPHSPSARRLLYVVEQILGFPRHLSQHVGGMVITRGPLCELVPIENAAMPERTVISWDKNDLDELGILKVDCLGLGMLTAIHRAFDLVEKHTGRALTLAGVPEGDPEVYGMICRADTVGVFQIESRAQMSMLPRLRPRSYYDLVIEVAIVRPGPIQGQMVHPYLRRRMGIEPVEYPTEEIRQVLAKTLGVPIFQEQAMRLAIVAAGFTAGQADQLRRAMGAWRRTGVIDQFRQQLLEGMQRRGLSREFAEQVFRQIRGFGEYGFPESHAASFALLVYISAWLKFHYPAAFTAALLNSQPMGFYPPAQLVRDALRHQVPVLPVDVHASDWDCTLEPSPVDPPPAGRSAAQSPAGGSAWALRLGFRLLRGLSEKDARRIVAARQAGPFADLVDFTRRTRLGRAALERLTKADVFRSLHLERRQALWHVLAQEDRSVDLPLFSATGPEQEDQVALPVMGQREQVFQDYVATGLSLKDHPMAFYRDKLCARNIGPLESLDQVANGAQVTIAGLVLLRQRPSTARGITFVTLEDETAVANLILHQAVWERYYTIARRSPAWIARGRLERRWSVTHIVVHHLEDLSDSLRRLSVKARDFR
jgi:error-prone DNA polymerase